MANYPASLPSIASAGANLSTNPHSGLHNSLRDELLAIATELGTDPSSTSATVKARLDAMVNPYTGALTTWTPTVTQGVALTPSITYARYQRTGRMVTGWFSLTIGAGAGTALNPVIIGGLPVTGALTGFPVGSAQLYDASAPAAYVAVLYMVTTTTFDMRVSAPSGSNQLGVTGFSAGLANTPDTISGCFHYEGAS